MPQALAAGLLLATIGTTRPAAAALPAATVSAVSTFRPAVSGSPIRAFLPDGRSDTGAAGAMVPPLVPPKPRFGGGILPPSYQSAGRSAAAGVSAAGVPRASALAVPHVIGLRGPAPFVPPAGGTIIPADRTKTLLERLSSRERDRLVLRRDTSRETVTRLPARAAGGFVDFNRPVQAGERGPELYVPGTTSLDRLSGGSTAVLSRERLERLSAVRVTSDAVRAVKALQRETMRLRVEQSRQATLVRDVRRLIRTETRRDAAVRPAAFIAAPPRGPMPVGTFRLPTPARQEGALTPGVLAPLPAANSSRTQPVAAPSPSSVAQARPDITIHLGPISVSVTGADNPTETARQVATALRLRLSAELRDEIKRVSR